MRPLKFRAVLNGKVRYDVTGFEHGTGNEMAGVFLNGEYHTINEDCIVEQFTGKQDNDGVNIYEGDDLYIETSFRQDGTPTSTNSGYVYYNDDKARFEMRPRPDQMGLNIANALGNYAPICKVTVTGNIHENPIQP